MLKTGSQQKHLLVEIEIDMLLLEEEVDACILAKIKNREISLKGFRQQDITPAIAKENIGQKVREQLLNNRVKEFIELRVTKSGVHRYNSSLVPIKDHDNKRTYWAVIAPVHEVTVDDIKKIQVTLPVIHVSDADVETRIEFLERKQSQWIRQDDDVVQLFDKINFIILSTDVPNLVNLLFTHSSCIVGDGDFFLSFEEKILGSKTGTIYVIDTEYGQVETIITSIHRVTSLQPISIQRSLVKKDLTVQAHRLSFVHFCNSATQALSRIPLYLSPMLVDYKKKSLVEIQSELYNLKLSLLFEMIESVITQTERDQVDLNLIKTLYPKFNDSDSKEKDRIITSYLSFEWIKRSCATSIESFDSIKNFKHVMAKQHNKSNKES